MKLTRSALTLWLVLLVVYGRANTLRPGSIHGRRAALVRRTLIIENAGQWPDAPGAGQALRFQVWGSGPTLWLAEDALWMSVVARSHVDMLERSHVGTLERDNVPRVNVRLSFPGATPHPRLKPFARLDTHVSYFLGNDPAGWRPDVPVWGGVRYVDLFPGIDLVVGAGVAGIDPALASAQQGGQPQGSPLPWWLEARAGADLAAVRLRVEGADVVVVDGNVLRLGTAAGEVRVPLLAVAGLKVEGSYIEH